MVKILSIITCIASLISALVAVYLLAEKFGWLNRLCTCEDDCDWCDDEDYLEFCDDCNCEDCEEIACDNE